VGVIIFFKIKIKIDFQSKDIYCNTHGSLKNKYSEESMGLHLFKDNKIYKLSGIKASCCDGFRCSYPIGNNIQEYWNALINGVSGAAPITYFDLLNLELICVRN
jgi:hypothetical protein